MSGCWPSLVAMLLECQRITCAPQSEGPPQIKSLTEAPDTSLRLLCRALYFRSAGIIFAAVYTADAHLQCKIPGPWQSSCLPSQPHARLIMFCSVLDAPKGITHIPAVPAFHESHLCTKQSRRWSPAGPSAYREQGCVGMNDHVLCMRQGNGSATLLQPWLTLECLHLQHGWGRVIHFCPSAGEL